MQHLLKAVKFQKGFKKQDQSIHINYFCWSDSKDFPLISTPMESSQVFKQ